MSPEHPAPVPLAPDSGQSDPARAELSRELRRFSLCRHLKHQFQLIAKPAAPAPARTKAKGKSGRGSRSPWTPVQKPPKRRPGLAAARQARLTEGARREALAPMAPADLSWPAAMLLERQHCRTPEEVLSWSERWAETLSGRIAAQRLAAAKPERRSIGGAAKAALIPG